MVDRNEQPGNIDDLVDQINSLALNWDGADQPEDGPTINFRKLPENVENFGEALQIQSVHRIQIPGSNFRIMALNFEGIDHTYFIELDPSKLNDIHAKIYISHQVLNIIKSEIEERAYLIEYLSRMSKQERSPEDSIQFLPDKESEKPYRERIDGIVQIVKRLTNSPSPFIYLDYLVKNDQQNNKVSLIVIIQLGDDKLYFELDLTNIDQSIEQEDLVKNKMREVFERQQKRSRYLLELSLQRSD